MSLIKTVVVGLAAATTLIAGGLPSASAAPVDVASTVKIKGFKVGDDQRVTFRGTVVSAKGICEDNRRIVLKQTEVKVVAGRATSNDGKWKVSFDGDDIPPGKFLAIMKEKTVKKAGKTYVCAADKATYDAAEG